MPLRCAVTTRVSAIRHLTPEFPMPSPFLLPVLALAVCMVGAAEFMLAPMLAPLASTFHTSPAHASGLVSAYALSYAAAAPLMGWLSDRAGRRRVLLVATLLFAADSIAADAGADTARRHGPANTRRPRRGRNNPHRLRPDRRSDTASKAGRRHGQRHARYDRGDRGWARRGRFADRSLGLAHSVSVDRRELPCGLRRGLVCNSARSAKRLHD
ncbi:hypothetical protein CBM2637_B100345 [Cupriavidus taiwanensis]|nr:hypothetical protein CBM2637_B100345 [Cupriavidus taiwanensis]